MANPRRRPKCMKCTNETNHASGMCVPCRSFTCTVCKKVKIPMKVRPKYALVAMATCNECLRYSPAYREMRDAARAYQRP